MENERYLIKKIFKIFIFMILVIIGLTFIMGFYYEHNVYLKLNDITVELGDKLPVELLHSMNILTDKSNLSIESNVPLDDDGNTIIIGPFSYYLVYRDDNYHFTRLTNIKSEIKVVDTVKPVITAKEKNEFAYSSNLSPEDIFDCFDLSGCKMKIEEEIDTTKSGEYEINVTAVDGANNISYAKTTIKILDKPKVSYNPQYRNNFKNMNNHNNEKNAELSEEEKENLRLEIANFAKKFIGNPYVYGGTSLTNGADCSGFTMSIYANYGYSLPRISTDQAYVGKSISESELKPGDLVVYFTDGHVALYVGNGKIVHASTPKAGIIYDDMYSGYRLYRRIIY